MADADYDKENIFAKILDGKVPCHKVRETKSTLAFLDAFPMVQGHTLVIPKKKGYKDLLSMPPNLASEFLDDVQKVAKAVQKATGATGINIWNNNGADSGQTVFHPHVHIVPRFNNDGLHSYPTSGSQLSKEDAAPILKKITDVLNPPKKAKFNKVSNVKPDGKGLNLRMKVLKAPEKVEMKGSTFYDVHCGDTSGTVILSLREDQKGACTVDGCVIVRNGAVKMISNHIRLCVDKWGKIEHSEEAFEGDVNMEEKKNVSALEYELVSK